MRDVLLPLKIMSGLASAYLLLEALRDRMRSSAHHAAASTISTEEKHVNDLVRLAIMGRATDQRATEIAGYDYTDIA